MLRAAFKSALQGSAPQARHWKTAWLLRFSGATCPQWEHRCDVYAAGTSSSRPWALCFNRVTSIPHPWRLISRLRPRFCATLVPGHSRVPRAERVMARTFKSSTRMVSKRRANRWWSFPPSYGADRFRAPATALSLASFAPADSIRGALGPDEAAIGAAAWPHQPLGQEPSAARRWTAPPIPRHHDPHPQRCHHQVAGHSPGWRRKRCATALIDPG